MKITLSVIFAITFFSSAAAQIGFTPRTDNSIPDTARAAELLGRARSSMINGNQPGASTALDQLSESHSAFKPAERMLLQARWYLAAGDSAGFEDGYWETVDFCRTTGDFDALLHDTAPIFTPLEAQQLENLETPESKAAFLTKFWRSRDPDPISQTNPRLITHYNRLLEAQQNYSRPVYTSLRRARNHGGGKTKLVDPTAPLVDFPFQQPSPQHKQPDGYELDPRGLVYLRHGAPNRTIRRIPEGLDREQEIWFYGSASFTFESIAGTEQFIAVPGGTADVESALETESAIVEVAEQHQQYYAAEFMGNGDTLVLEFYQSYPADSLTVIGEPGAVAALFDTSWNEVTVSRSPAKKMKAWENDIWIAVNRLKAAPGKYYCALRMDLDPARPVIRNSMTLRAFPKDSLNLSGIIFGHPTDPDLTIPNRSQEGLLPRPSLVFTVGEEVSVYFEIYGLERASDGQREYAEMITVSRVEPGDESNQDNFSGGAERLKRWSENRSNSRTLSFDRVADSGQTTVSENFIVDTSDLEPGSYRLQLEVEDKVSGERRDVTWFFDLQQAPLPEYNSQF